jgi:hypothetical protein
LQNDRSSHVAGFVLAYPPLGAHDALNPETVVLQGVQPGDANEAHLREVLASPLVSLTNLPFELLQTIAAYYEIPVPDANTLLASAHRIYRSVFINL